MSTVFHTQEFWNGFFDVLAEGLTELCSRKDYKYEIIKEAQIRSELFCYLKKKGYLVEVEADVLKKNNKPYNNACDIRIIEKNQDVFVEIKRAWSIADWTNNQYPRQLQSWKDDIDKMCPRVRLKYKIKGRTKKEQVRCFLLVAIYKNEEGFEGLPINDIKDYVKKKWNTDFIPSEKKKLAKNKFLRCFVWVSY